MSIRQLHDAGLGRNAVSTRVRDGRLHRIHRGVYAVGHLGLSAEGTWMAAVLACGRGAAEASARTVLARWGAVLSHRSAAALWLLLPRTLGPTDISIPTKGGRQERAGIRLHRRRRLDESAATLRNGIPTTTAAKTIADLRPVVSDRELRRAIRQADVLGLSLGPEVMTDRTRSDLEREFLALCRRHRLPPPQVNVRIGGLEVDFLWRDAMLVVETDGYRFHRGRAAFEDDRARDLELRARGFEVVRLSETQIVREQERVAAILRACIASALRRVGANGDD